MNPKIQIMLILTEKPLSSRGERYVNEQIL